MPRSARYVPMLHKCGWTSWYQVTSFELAFASYFLFSGQNLAEISRWAVRFRLSSPPAEREVSPRAMASSAGRCSALGDMILPQLLISVLIQPPDSFILIHRTLVCIPVACRSEDFVHTSYSYGSGNYPCDHRSMRGNHSQRDQLYNGLE